MDSRYLNVIRGASQVALRNSYHANHTVLYRLFFHAYRNVDTKHVIEKQNRM